MSRPTLGPNWAMLARLAFFVCVAATAFFLRGWARCITSDDVPSGGGPLGAVSTCYQQNPIGITGTWEWGLIGGSLAAVFIFRWLNREQYKSQVRRQAEGYQIPGRSRDKRR